MPFDFFLYLPGTYPEYKYGDNLFMDSADSSDSHSDTQDIVIEISGPNPEPYPLNIPETSDTQVIPDDIITPHSDDEDHHLSLLINEVRIAYKDSVTFDTKYRKTGNFDYLELKEFTDSVFFFFFFKKKRK